MKRIKGRALYPPPVAHATFAAGETIRMSFYQPAGKPWRFEAARGMLAQAIGNERVYLAREAATDDAALTRKVQALHDRPGTEGERCAAAEALKRIDARKLMAELSAKIDALPRMNAHAPARDLIAFWIEHDGKRIDEPTSNVLPMRKRKPTTEPLREVMIYDPAAFDILKRLVAAEGPGRKIAIRALVREARELLASRAA